MPPRFSKTNLHKLGFSFLAGIVILSYEACSPMKPASEVGNVCSPMYAPPANLLSKTESQKSYKSNFEQKKVHLDDSVMGKATTLKNKQVIVDILMSCSPEKDSLSEKVLAQNSGKILELKRQAFHYTVEENISIDQLTEHANADSCVRGIAPEVPVHLSSLVLTSSDTSLAYQTHLTSSNYAHAYKSMVLEADSIKARVAFVDTGVDCSHPDLAANLTSGCGASFVSGQSLDDVDGHGTHTLGIVGAIADNNLGIMGIAGNTATMTAIKVIHNGSGSSLAAANGIEDAINRNVDVINISLQAESALTEVEQKIQDAVAAGIVVVLAAGNYGERISPSDITSPAIVGKDLDGAITVGSINADSHGLSYFSNYGDYVEIAAPGALTGSKNAEQAGLFSTDINGDYIRMMGTSQAAPVVTGAAALLVQFFKQRSVGYTPAQIEQIIKASTDSNPAIRIQGGRVLNFSKLTRAAYQHAGLDLCDKSKPYYPNSSK